jgi:hypothetical protein
VVGHRQRCIGVVEDLNFGERVDMRLARTRIGLVVDRTGGHHLDVVVRIEGFSVVQHAHAAFAGIAELRFRVGVQFDGDHLGAIEVGHRANRLIKLEITDVAVNRVDLLESRRTRALAKGRHAERRDFHPAFARARWDDKKGVDADEDAVLPHLRLDRVAKFRAVFPERSCDSFLQTTQSTDLRRSLETRWIRRVFVRERRQTVHETRPVPTAVPCVRLLA